MRKWDAGEALNVIERERVTRFTGVPTMMRDLLEHPDFSPERTASLTSTIAGGAPVPPAQVRPYPSCLRCVLVCLCAGVVLGVWFVLRRVPLARVQVASMRKKSKAISAGQGYGMTETMGLGTINRGADYLRNPTSCGRPVPIMIELKVVDVTTGAEVPEGARGEVCIKGATVMKECVINASPFLVCRLPFLMHLLTHASRTMSVDTMASLRRRQRLSILRGMSHRVTS
jgi:long-chain acyl-CoA synthetase